MCSMWETRKNTTIFIEIIPPVYKVFAVLSNFFVSFSLFFPNLSLILPANIHINRYGRVVIVMFMREDVDGTLNTGNKEAKDHKCLSYLLHFVSIIILIVVIFFTVHNQNQHNIKKKLYH